MSIRFGWTRPQARAEKTDDEDVEDGAPAPPELAARPAQPEEPAVSPSGPVDADADDPDADRSTGAAVRPPSPEEVQAIRDVHARVFEFERKTHRLIGAAAARRAF